MALRRAPAQPIESDANKAVPQRKGRGSGGERTRFRRTAVRALARFLGIIFALGWVSALFWLVLLEHAAGNGREAQRHFALPDQTLPSSSSSGGVGTEEAEVNGDGTTNNGLNLPPRPYKLSPLCRRCAHEAIDARMTCGEEIREEVIKWWEELKILDSHHQKLLHPTFRLPREELLTANFDLPEWSMEAAQVYDDVRLAAEKVAKRHPEKCGTCDPTQCQDGTQFFRFDANAPYHERAVTLALPSVPRSARVPPHLIRDEERALRWVRRQWDGTANRREWLFEYNPTLVHLPPSIAANLGLGAATGHNKGGAAKKEAEYYLASFRLTSANGCFTKRTYEYIEGEQWKAIRNAPNHLGLAVLDENLSIVPGYDIVVDVERGLGMDEDRKKIGPAFMDYRIYVSADDRVWLSTNGQSVHIAQITLDKGVSAKKWGWRGSKEAVAMSGSEDGKTLLPNLHGTGISVTVLGNFSTVWTGGFHGNGYALFQTPDMFESRPTEFLAEINVWPNHVVQRLDPSVFSWHEMSEIRTRQRPGLGERGRERADMPEPLDGPEYWRRYDIWRRKMKEVGGRAKWMNEANLTRSAATLDELWFPLSSMFEEQQHGGACCVKIPVDMFPVGSFAPDDQRPYDFPRFPSSSFPQSKMFPLPSGFGRASEEPIRARREGRPFRVPKLGVDHLLVGVGHTKIPKDDMKGAEMMPHMQYVSFFYAFDPKPPYQIRLASGYFCLGFPDEYDEDGSGVGMNHFIYMTYRRLLTLNRETFACPQMHYVSGIVDKIGDSSTAVVSYSINDCVPRMLEIDKREIVSRLHGLMYHTTQPDPKSARRTVP